MVRIPVEVNSSSVHVEYFSQSLENKWGPKKPALSQRKTILNIQNILLRYLCPAVGRVNNFLTISSISWLNAKPSIWENFQGTVLLFVSISFLHWFILKQNRSGHATFSRTFSTFAFKSQVRSFVLVTTKMSLPAISEERNDISYWFIKAGS